MPVTFERGIQTTEIYKLTARDIAALLGADPSDKDGVQFRMTGVASVTGTTVCLEIIRERKHQEVAAFKPGEDPYAGLGSGCGLRPRARPTPLSNLSTDDDGHRA